MIVRHILQLLLFVVMMMMAYQLLFLFFQKPLFIIYNRGKKRMTAHDVRCVYQHGLRIDVAMAGYLVLPVIVIIAVGQFLPAHIVRLSMMVYVLLSGLLVALASVADAVLYEYWDSKLDASVLMFLNSKGKFSSVSRLFLAVAIAGFLTLTAVMSAVLYLPTYILHTSLDASILPWWAKLGGGILLLVVAVLIYLYLIWGGMLRHSKHKVVKPNSPSKVFFSSEPFLNHAALNPFYNFLYTLTYSGHLDKEFQFMPSEEAEQIYRHYFTENGGRSTAPTESASLLKTSRPNIILVFMESFGAPFVKSLGGYDDVSPRFEQLIRGGIFFTHCYCSSVRTDRAIVSMESGYPGQPTYSIIKSSHKIATLPGLPKSLRFVGYDTQLVHGGDLSICNKYEYYQLCGHNKLVDIYQFDESQRQQRWGVPDHLVYEWMIDDIIRRKEQSDRPWMMTMQSLSSHLPYDVPWQLLDDKVKNSYAYADLALWQFVDSLKNIHGVWDNLLLVCMADHGMPTPHLTPHMPAFAHIPWLMMGGAVRQPMTVDKVVSQTDLPATILSMLGLSHDDFIFSRDVFSSEYTYPCAFNTYNNGLMFRDASGCTVYDNSSQKVTCAPSQERERAGKGILQYLYSDLSKR